VQRGIFVDMARPGALANALRPEARRAWPAVAQAGLEVALQQYDLQRLKQDYVERYRAIAGSATPLPRWTLQRRIERNLAAAWRRLMLRLEGQAE
jgi:hypothetical protein